MAGKKVVFFCKDCGHEEPRWLGRCPGCGSWNTFSEKTLTDKKSRPARGGFIQEDTSPRLMSQIGDTGWQRFSAGLSEMDRVLGGGMVPGSAVLIGGEPGIGKSTLMLQLCLAIPEGGTGLYISGEESPEQVKMRSDRLSIKAEKLYLYSTTALEDILTSAEKEKPSLLIIDSIQTIYSPAAGDIPGTVNQLKYCTFELIRFCKNTQTVLFLLAHVTKEGQIAGPKAIEHMVDTVLLFDHLEGDYRSLRPVKNRFGPTDEIGLFAMTGSGLRQIGNPGEIFLGAERKEIPPGVSIGAVYEGSRVLLVEIQALSVFAKGGSARNYSDRIDPIRISRLSAILEKYTGVKFAEQDLYVNVAGGLRITDLGCDLAVALALFSARTGVPLKKKTLALGELSLSGEIRSPGQLARRIKTAAETGFRHFLCPLTDRDHPILKEMDLPKDITIISTHHIKDAVKQAFQPEPSNRDI